MNKGSPWEYNPNFPWVDKLLIEALERNIKAEYPELHWEDRKIWYKAGQLSVIRLLKEHHELQKEE